MKQKLLKEYIRSLLELHLMPGSALGDFFRGMSGANRYTSPKSRTKTKKAFLDDLHLDKKTRHEVETLLDRGDKTKAKELLTKALEAKNAEIEENSLKKAPGGFSTSGLRRMEAPENFREGRQIKGGRSSLQNDCESERIDTNDAAVVLVKNGDKFLAVSRCDEFDNLNMPGGHIEAGETPVDAATREVHEETGLKVGGLKTLFVDERRGKRVYVFQAEDFSGDLQSSHEGLASWEIEENMLNGQYCDTFKRAMKICR